MLVLGPKGHLVTKHKDRSYVVIQPVDSTPPPIQTDTLLEDVIADIAELEVQAASDEVPSVAKPKRKRDNKTQVCNRSLGNY